MLSFFSIRSFLRNWWVIAFVLMTIGIYMQAIHKKNQCVAILREKREALSSAQFEAMKKKEELELRINSHRDPEFMELVLREKLGVIGEEEVKVVFQ